MSALDWALSGALLVRSWAHGRWLCLGTVSALLLVWGLRRIQHARHVHSALGVSVLLTLMARWRQFAVAVDGKQARDRRERAKVK
jgi:hypothetical protein